MSILQQLRTHLSLHVHYVKEDIGAPPNIDRAIAITESAKTKSCMMSDAIGNIGRLKRRNP